MSETIETFYNEDGTTRARLIVDLDATPPSDDDPCWGVCVVTDWRSHLDWIGDQHHGVVDADERWSLGDPIAARYLRVFHDTLITGVSYSRGDWGWVVTERQDDDPDTGAWERRHESNVERWLDYLKGDVYGVIVERAVTWRPVDPDDQDMTLTTYEEVEDGALWGLEGWEYAHGVARASAEAGHVTY